MDRPDVRLVEELAARLDAPPRSAGVAVSGWRFALANGWSLRAGLRHDQLGGPYEPPSAAHGTSGSIYLFWSDGAISRGSLDSRSVEDFEERLAEWRANSYADPDAPEILAPQPLPAVKTADPAVEGLLDGDPTPFLHLVERGRRRLADGGLGRTHAEAGASRGWRFILNSAGLRVAYPRTSASLYLGAEELYSRSFGKRRLPTEAETEELIEDVATTARLLGDRTTAPSGELPVLLMPGLAMSMLGAFLISNLSGAAVVVGHSAYSLEDFRAGRQVTRQDLSVMVDSTLDLELAASPCSAEGVPGGRAVLIERGQLARPLVGLKYAGKSGFPPTPVTSGPPGFLLETSRSRPTVGEIRARFPTLIQLSVVLGLNTQDSVSGRYSLVAPQALIVRDGQPTGRAKVSIGGGFLGHLLDERTELVSFPWSLTPGLLIWTALEGQA